MKTIDKGIQMMIWYNSMWFRYAQKSVHTIATIRYAQWIIFAERQSMELVVVRKL